MTDRHPPGAARLPRPLEVSRVYLALAGALMAVIVPGLSAVGAYVASYTAQAVAQERMDQRLRTVEAALEAEARARTAAIAVAAAQQAQALENATAIGRQERASLRLAMEVADRGHTTDIAAIRASNESLQSAVNQLLGYLTGRFGMPAPAPRQGNRMEGTLPQMDDGDQVEEAMAHPPAVPPSLPMPLHILPPVQPQHVIPPRSFAQTGG